MTLSPLDDYPVHQIPEVMRHVGTSDRNFYDRYYFNAFPLTGDAMLIVGLGQYPRSESTRLNSSHVVTSRMPSSA